MPGGGYVSRNNFIGAGICIRKVSPPYFFYDAGNLSLCWVIIISWCPKIWRRVEGKGGVAPRLGDVKPRLLFEVPSRCTSVGAHRELGDNEEN